MKRKRVFKWILLLTWMGVIFYMSHQPGDVSSNQSNFILELFNTLGISLDSYFGELATLLIRKAAHFTEYCILFILSYNVIKYYFNINTAKWYSLLFVFLYACSDEFHQYFIPGRGPAFTDVLIDTSGGVLGLILVYLFEKRKIKKSKNA